MRGRGIIKIITLFANGRCARAEAAAAGVLAAFTEWLFICTLNTTIIISLINKAAQVEEARLKNEELLRAPPDD